MKQQTNCSPATTPLHISTNNAPLWKPMSTCRNQWLPVPVLIDSTAANGGTTSLAAYWASVYIHTYTHLTALCPGLPGWVGTRKVKPIWILLKQETVSGSGISWTICKSAPHSTTPDRQPCQQPTTQFLQAGCPSCCPTNSVKALKATVHQCNMAKCEISHCVIWQPGMQCPPNWPILSPIGIFTTWQWAADQHHLFWNSAVLLTLPMLSLQTVLIWSFLTIIRVKLSLTVMPLRPTKQTATMMYCQHNVYYKQP